MNNLTKQILDKENKEQQALQHQPKGTPRAACLLPHRAVAPAAC
jgi:hypothetical protein